ncbi:hypothetical protein [Symbioplanes lichenis]|uniref:hypothetical protein n=1 Tax=Symbioplanes lichenis TaxID=1629072 RepID=UPI002739EE7B|nr:hypothetical protein [Actinoplanes lichenis]
MNEPVKSAAAPKSTTMKISTAHRDALARIASTLGVATLDEALGDVIFLYESMRAVEQLSAQEIAEWRREAHEWAEAGPEVSDR